MNTARTARFSRRARWMGVALIACAWFQLVSAAGAQEPVFEPPGVKPSTGNRPGFTYRSFSQLFSSCMSCQEACQGDPQCRAWTCFHPSGLYAPEGVAPAPMTCHLKSELPPLSPFPGNRDPKPTRGNGVVDDRCYTSSHAIRLSDAAGGGYSRAARAWRDPNVAASVAQELAEERRLLEMAYDRLEAQRVGIVKPADRLVLTDLCTFVARPAARRSPPRFAVGLLGATLKLSEYGFSGTFTRQGEGQAWTGRWPGGCERTTFSLLSAPSVRIEGEDPADVQVVLLRQDGDERTCPYSPGLRAEYHLSATADGATITLRGRRVVTDPGTKGSLSWLKGNVADVSGSATVRQ